MTVKHKICVELLTPLPLTSQEDGDQVLSLWESFLPRCLPEKVGNWEPLDHEFDLARRNEVLQLWRWPFLALRRTAPRMEAQVFMRKSGMRQHATWILSFDSDTSIVSEVGRFLRQATVVLKADFGCLTLLTEAEIEAGRRNGTVSALDKGATRFNFFIASQHIEKCIPDVYWITVFGAPYVNMFGSDKLLSAPIHQVEQLGSTAFLLQLTPSLDDARLAPSTFAETKKQIKQHLGDTAFFDSERLGDCMRPNFVWR